MLAISTTSLRGTDPSIYAMVERVVFEPNDAAPRRVLIWGAFANIDGNLSKAERGYLYFFTDGFPNKTDGGPPEVVGEGKAIKGAAGSRDAVAFSRWYYIVQRGDDPKDYGRIRVRPISELPSNPDPYQIIAGTVKVTAGGDRGVIVRLLRDALRK